MIRDDYSLKLGDIRKESDEILFQIITFTLSGINIRHL